MATAGVADHLGITEEDAKDLLIMAKAASGKTVKLGNGGAGDCMKSALWHIPTKTGGRCSDYMPDTPLTLEEASSLLQRARVGHITVAKGEAGVRAAIVKQDTPLILIVDLKNGASGHAIAAVSRSALYDRQRCPGHEFRTLGQLGASEITAVGKVVLW